MATTAQALQALQHQIEGETRALGIAKSEQAKKTELAKKAKSEAEKMEEKLRAAHKDIAKLEADAAVADRKVIDFEQAREAHQQGLKRMTIELERAVKKAA